MNNKNKTQNYFDAAFGFISHSYYFVAGLQENLFYSL
jgi:hypothetical protein